MVRCGRWIIRRWIAVAAVIAAATTAAPRPVHAQTPAPTAPQTAATTAPQTTAPVASPPGLLDPAAVLQSPIATQTQRDQAALRLVQRQTPEARQALAAALSDPASPPAQLAAAK